MVLRWRSLRCALIVNVPSDISILLGSVQYFTIFVPLVVCVDMPEGVKPPGRGYKMLL